MVCGLRKCPFLLKLTIVEKSSLIAQFHCFIILIKFQYANNTITKQCELKRNLGNFSQDPIFGVKLIKTLHTP
jgi:hypothetical protein